MNEKRIASCKLVGGDKKRVGHKRENDFGERWCDPTAITYKAEADKIITNPQLLAVLTEKLSVPSGRCSIKSGKNLQFTLGNIPEITEADDKLKAISQPNVWQKYLGKSLSQCPADILVYRHEDRWVFFNMHAVIAFVVASCVWRETSTGRLKGDFQDGSKKGSRQYLTYEYRETHKGYFLGANGNRGRSFIELLQTTLPFHEEVDK